MEFLPLRKPLVVLLFILVANQGINVKASSTESTATSIVTPTRSSTTTITPPSTPTTVASTSTLPPTTSITTPTPSTTQPTTTESTTTPITTSTSTTLIPTTTSSTSATTITTVPSTQATTTPTTTVQTTITSQTTTTESSTLKSTTSAKPTSTLQATSTTSTTTVSSSSASTASATTATTTEPTTPTTMQTSTPSSTSTVPPSTTTSTEATTSKTTTPTAGPASSEAPETSSTMPVTSIQTTILVSESTTSKTCNPGYFGPTCLFQCMCANYSEACDVQSGFCTSGCPAGFQGPGCNLRMGGNEPVVVMLGVLLTLAILTALILLVALARLLRQGAYAASAEKHAYDSPVMMEGFIENLAKAPDSIPRISEMDIQLYTDPLGEGRYGEILPGKVQRGRKRIDAAFKTLKEGASEAERNGLMAQLELYGKLAPHANIIQFYGVCIVGDQIYAAFEHAANGNLRNFLRQSSMPESDAMSPALRNETLLINFCIEVAQGMQYLESTKIIHRELMSRHIFVTKNNTCKIAGLNPPISASDRNQNNLTRWMSPESLQEGVFTHKSDVWSFGILMWEVMSLGGQPYPDVAAKDLPGLISGTYRMPVPDDCSLEMYDVMRLCWEEEPENRPSFSEVIDRLNIVQAAVDETSIDIEDDETLA